MNSSLGFLLFVAIVAVFMFGISARFRLWVKGVASRLRRD